MAQVFLILNLIQGVAFNALCCSYQWCRNHEISEVKIKDVLSYRHVHYTQSSPHVCITNKTQRRELETVVFSWATHDQLLFKLQKQQVQYDKCQDYTC